MHATRQDTWWPAAVCTPNRLGMPSNRHASTCRCLQPTLPHPAGRDAAPCPPPCAQGAEIGKDFPPQLVKCMKHMSAKTAETIQAEYGYPNLRMADTVRNRTRGGWVQAGGRADGQAASRGAGLALGPGSADATRTAGRQLHRAGEGLGRVSPHTALEHAHQAHVSVVQQALGCAGRTAPTPSPMTCAALGLSVRPCRTLACRVLRRPAGVRLRVDAAVGPAHQPGDAQIQDSAKVL